MSKDNFSDQENSLIERYPDARPVMEAAHTDDRGPTRRAFAGSLVSLLESSVGNFEELWKKSSPDKAKAMVDEAMGG